MNPETCEKELSSLKSDLNALRITLIGIDGKNGMRSQIEKLYQETAELKETFINFMQTVGNLELNKRNQDLTYATKKELRDVEEKILNELKEQNREQIKRLKDYEEEKREENKRLRGIRWTLYITLIGILVREAFQYI
jgi:hypothetical protein